MKASLARRTKDRSGRQGGDHQRYAPHSDALHSYTPHLWIACLTILALAAVYVAETFAAPRPPAESTSTLLPVISPPGGYYERDVHLKITAPGPNTHVIFSVDGSVPTLSSGTIYTRTIRLSAEAPAVTVVRARAMPSDGKLGPVASESYLVGVPATLPMMSLIVDPGDLWDAERGIYANPNKRGDTWERPVDVTYVDRDRRSGFHVPAGLRIHGKSSRNFSKKPLRIYFRQEYGASRLEYPLFAGGDVRSFKRLVLHSGGQDWPYSPDMNWTLMRTQLVADLVLELDGYAARSQPVLLFINGEPWGIYQMRERLDEHFLADHRGIDSADFLENPQLLSQPDIPPVGSKDWERILEFIDGHDLADPANYAYVQTQVDITNFIDYIILEIYVANIDWPFNNVRQFRPRVQGGRWHWLFWDTDQGFGAYPSSVNANLMNRVLDEDHPETGGRDTLLFRKLLENPVFFERFLSRTADLLNTTLAPQPVLTHIDALAAELEPDINYEAIRWSSSVDWLSGVQDLREFARQRPDFVRQHVVDSFGLGGTAQLVVNPPTSGSGSVAVNGSLIQDLPWQGIYFHDVPIQMQAAPAPGFRFAGWDSPGLPQTPVITLTVRNDTRTLTPRFEPLGDDAPRPGDVIFAAYDMGQDSHLEADQFELLLMCPGSVDLRGWRVTDNDTKTATDEGSLIFADHPALAHVPSGTRIQIIASHAVADLPADDVSTWDRQMVLHTGNGHLDTEIDPGFNLGPQDNLVLLAPGPTQAFDDDQGIDFVAQGTAVTPASFGVLTDGVLPSPAEAPLDHQTHVGIPAWGLGLVGAAVLYLNVRRNARRND